MLSFVMSPLLMPPLFGFQSASLFPALARSRIAERRSMSGRCLAAEYLFANEASAGVPINDEKGFAHLVVYRRCEFHRVAVIRHRVHAPAWYAGFPVLVKAAR